MKESGQQLPIIGIVPTFDEGEIIGAGGPGIERIYLRRDYLRTIASIGATPLILSPEVPLRAIIAMCDGVVISGGLDIDPRHYGEQPIPQLRNTEPDDRFKWEKELIEACDDNDIPILGICYGIQRLNVHYGGSLIQDIPSVIGESVLHDNVKHEVLFKREFLGFHPAEKRMVASRHHQALARLSDNASVCATSADGVVEAAIFGGKHYGMQWHPESDETGVHVYRIFAEHCQAPLEEYNESYE